MMKKMTLAAAALFAAFAFAAASDPTTEGAPADLGGWTMNTEAAPRTVIVDPEAPFVLEAATNDPRCERDCYRAYRSCLRTAKNKSDQNECNGFLNACLNACN